MTTINLTNNMLAKLAFVTEFTFSNNVRYYLNGVLVEVKKGRELVFVATDGHALAKAESPISGLNDCELSFIVPIESIKDFVKNSTKAIEISISYDSLTEEITLKADCYRITVKAIKGNYPNYSKVIPRSDRGVSLQSGDFLGVDIALVEKVIKAWKSYKKFIKCKGYFCMNVSDVHSSILFKPHFDDDIMVLIMPCRLS